ncbi:hypothetical protein EV07_0709 [Prochlorococcus sp. MIT 0603]|nr:hypothetical protein EV07_0709 [Prochlorococcus sp. MIT 0603]
MIKVNSSLLLTFFFLANLFIIYFLILTLKKNVDRQINSQIDKMIPLKSLRDKVRIQIKWR